MNAPATTLLTGLLALFTAAWLQAFLATPIPESASTLWLVRQQGLYLSGILSLVLMALAMFLSIRPKWLEAPLGGMDRIYRLHKWSGILATLLAVTHWGFYEASGLVRSLVGRSGRVREAKGELARLLHDPAEDLGEWGFYLLLALVAITLLRRFPYHLWRHSHRAMPVVYLPLAFHGAVLTPAHYWATPFGILFATALILGSVAAVLSLAGRIGSSRRARGKVIAVRRNADITEITCRLDDRWNGHQPGQFAFLAFDRIEGHHPFTIASASNDQRTVTFCIKALGNFTRRLPHTTHVGQEVSVEGPYGHFRLDRHDPTRRQIWIAGGVGVTPFLAWLEALQDAPSEAPQAELHYCTRDRDGDPFVSRLEQLCAALPNIHLHIHDKRQGQTLEAATLRLGSGSGDRRRAEIWFCGPTGLAEALKRGLRAFGSAPRFHQEAFEMR